MFDRASLQDFRKGANDFREVPKRLLEYVDCPCQVFFRQGTTRRHEEARNIGTDRLEHLQRLRPVQVRHLNVHQNNIDPLLTKEIEGCTSAAGDEDGEAVVLKSRFQKRTDAFVVVHNENRSRPFHLRLPPTHLHNVEPPAKKRNGNTLRLAIIVVNRESFRHAVSRPSHSSDAAYPSCCFKSRPSCVDRMTALRERYRTIKSSAAAPTVHLASGRLDVPGLPFQRGLDGFETAVAFKEQEA
jgi:hypothetical protein